MGVSLERTTTSTVCLLRQGREDNDEHVWGQWLKRYVRQDMRKHSLGASVVNRLGIPNEETSYIRAGDPLGIQGQGRLRDL
jgi:hypothetical protein